MTPGSACGWIPERLQRDSAALARGSSNAPYGGRACHPAETVARMRPLFGRFGITRLANITGLDKIGIPVWTTVRPNSKTVAVSQGKGADHASAQASSVMEAIELAVAENPKVATRRATANHLLAQGEAVEPMADLVARNQQEPAPDDELCWVPGYDLIHRCTTWVPFDAVRADHTMEGEGRYWQSSDGLASGNVWLEAVLHGLLERIERDATAIWRLRPADDALARCVDAECFGDPLLSSLASKVEGAGLRLRLFDMAGDIGVPAFFAAIGPGCRSGRRRWRHFDVACGTGCHPLPSRAAMRALMEAAQTRLTTIAGSRDDFHPSAYEAALKPDLYAYMDAEPMAGCGPHVRHLDHCDEDPLAFALGRLKGAGIGRAIAVPLSSPDEGFCVAKTLVPGLEHPDGDRRMHFGRRALATMLQPRSAGPP